MKSIVGTIQTIRINNQPPKVLYETIGKMAGINVVFDFPASLQVDDKQKTILERTAHTCPVMYSIHPDLEVKVEFNWTPAAVAR